MDFLIDVTNKINTKQIFNIIHNFSHNQIGMRYCWYKLRYYQTLEIIQGEEIAEVADFDINKAQVSLKINF